MSREPLQYLEDICESCSLILSFTEGIAYERFRADRMRVDAVARNLEVIGEAARHLPETVRDAMPDIAWNNIIGMRNILAHAYFGADTEILWSASTDKVGPLLMSVKKYLAKTVE